jgi:hypothetical protein
MSHTLVVGYSEAQLLGIGAIDVVGDAQPGDAGKPKQIKLSFNQSEGAARSWPIGSDLVDINSGAQKDFTLQTDRPAFLHSLVFSPGFVPGGGSFATLNNLCQVKNIVINGVRTYVGSANAGSAATGVPCGSFRPRGFLPSYLGQLTNNGKAVVTVVNGGDVNLHSANVMAFALCASQTR